MLSSTMDEYLPNSLYKILADYGHQLFQTKIEASRLGSKVI